MSTTEAEFIQLRAENDALKALLAKHGIEVPQPSKFNIGDAALQPSANGLSPTAKVQLFRRLFRGRDDIYPVRWINKAGKPGYSPLCANKWKPGVCKLPVIKCSACSHSLYAPITDDIIRDINETPKLRKRPAGELIRAVIDSVGGPLLHGITSEQEQRSFDSTCKKLNRFLAEQSDS